MALVEALCEAELLVRMQLPVMRSTVVQCRLQGEEGLMKGLTGCTSCADMSHLDSDRKT